MTPQDQLNKLIARLEKLSQVNQRMSVEIVRLREDIKRLREEIGYADHKEKKSNTLIDEVPTAKMEADYVPEIKIDFEKNTPGAIPPPLPGKPVSKTSLANGAKATPKKAFNLEEFIGGNLINKIGILILIVGLGLFVKYAIDNGYFPPIVRLVLSFLAGLSLVGIGYRLKPKYKTYSAVLFSGGMVVLYFSAYSGNAFYDPVLIPRLTSFILMVVFTVVTVLAAMFYNLEMIALIGLVGAYAVPLLLSDDSGNYKLFLSYIAIINSGLLLVSIRKYWRVSLYTAIGLTWLIVSFWVLVEYKPRVDTSTAWLFISLFFVLFYAALIAYNLLKHKEFTIDNVVFITINSFIFYGLGMVLLDNSNLEHYEGGFTILNGILHLGVAYWLYQSLSDKKLFFTLSGLFWIFLTVAIGVQFGGSTRALMWLGEGALIFGLGRRFEVSFYEIASYLLLFLGISFLFEYWGEGYYSGLVHQGVLFNKYFLASILSLGIIGTMLWMSKKWNGNPGVKAISDNLLLILFIGMLYASFFHEIYHQYEMAFTNSFTNGVYDRNILNFQTVWLINYSLLFVLGIGLLNIYWLHSKKMAGAVFVLCLFGMLAFLTGGILTLNELRTDYLSPALTPDFSETSYWIWIRYISYCFVAALAFCLYKTINMLDELKNVKPYFQLFIYFLILVFLSNELTTLMTVSFGVDADSLSHRVGFSILWALYSFGMIFNGFRNRSKIIRVAGIILFGLTLVKVFLVDLIDISTENRILLFVAIGILLLVTSFLYQKFGDVLLGEEENEGSEIRNEE